MSVAADLRIRAKAANARLNPGRRDPPPIPTGHLLSECSLGKGRVLRIALEDGHRPGDGVFVSLRAWSEGYPTHSQVSFRSESLPGVAMAIADALDRTATDKVAMDKLARPRRASLSAKAAYAREETGNGAAPSPERAR
jgi:hypothetical protein